MPEFFPTPTSARRWHTFYTEPRPHPDDGTSWTSPPVCAESREAAERHIAAVSLLGGRDALMRRRWTLAPCDGSCQRRSGAPEIAPNKIDGPPAGDGVDDDE